MYEKKHIGDLSDTGSLCIYILGQMEYLELAASVVMYVTLEKAGFYPLFSGIWHVSSAGLHFLMKNL
jgi:hypothetical protein